MDEVFKDLNGFFYAYIYLNDGVYEVWKRERIIGSVPPGNSHKYIGSFPSIEAARSAVAGLRPESDCKADPKADLKEGIRHIKVKKPTKTLPQ